jgi:hypothetical protein
MPTSTEAAAAFSRASYTIVDGNLSRTVAEAIRAGLGAQGLCDNRLWDGFFKKHKFPDSNGSPRPEAEGSPLNPITARKLMETDYPTPQFLVPGLIVEGLTLLAGRPKIGKSWLALACAVAVATGGEFLGRKATQGEVLYLALEDSPRRIKKRLRELGL